MIFHKIFEGEFLRTDLSGWFWLILSSKHFTKIIVGEISPNLMDLLVDATGMSGIVHSGSDGKFTI